MTADHPHADDEPYGRFPEPEASDYVLPWAEQQLTPVLEDGEDVHPTVALFERMISSAFLQEDRDPQRPRSQGALTMSGLGTCRRRRAWALAGIEPSDPVPVDEKRQAQMGTWLHDGLLPAMGRQAAGVLVEHPVEWTVAGLTIKGRLDLYANPHLLDLKSVGEYGMARAARRGWQDGHRHQTVGYSEALAQQGLEVEDRTVLIMDRARGDTLFLVEPHLPEHVADTTAWVEDLIRYAEGKPEHAPRDERGPGLSIICDGCEFLRACWGENAKPGVTGGQSKIIRESPEPNEAVERAAALYDEARDREKSAAEDKAFARAMLEGAEPGTYGRYKVRWKGQGHAVQKLDAKAAEARLKAAGIMVPMKDGWWSPSIDVTPVAPDL